jgi:hypothetical protein
LAIRLPGTEGPVLARVARKSRTTTGFALNQGPASLVLIDRALTMVLARPAA